MKLILAINPGSTSTKFAVYQKKKLLFEKSIRHTSEELAGFKRVSDQFGFRKKLIIKELSGQNIKLEDIIAIIGRGGLLKPIESGIYEVNETMKKDLIDGVSGEHASNLGGLIAADIAGELKNARAFIVDPVVVDEMQEVARYAGHPEFERVSIFHALNQKAVGRSYAESIGRNYEDINLIIAHMGGGVSVGVHRKGKVVDVNNGLNGEGPFSPERSGSLPAGQLVELCFSNKYSRQEMLKMLAGNGGMVAYLGSNNFMEICRMADSGDKKAKIIREAASYQVGKEIGACAAVLNGEADAIILTGGMAYQKSHTDYISNMVQFLAPVILYPGEDELMSLTYSGLLAIEGKIEIKIYK